ncbi:MAG: glycine cleavage T C-terminal barrel domain-containing protein, partial [Acidobacteriota bacterium]
VVRVLRQGDKFLFETEETTRQKVFDNLFRFTYAGDFFVEDLSAKFRCFEVLGSEPGAVATRFLFTSTTSISRFIEADLSDAFRDEQLDNRAVTISDELFETLRIENGTPKYGVDMDETTIVPELGLEGLISYNKGCYIGQEIIARIHFRGHVAKKLTGLLSEPGAVATGFLPNADLVTSEGKNAGRITSITFSPKLNKAIALGYVRYDFLAMGTDLMAGELPCLVSDLPFLN